MRAALNKENISFRNGQWESIDALINHRRLLVVQRTGWGKSMVYFLATKLLRERGSGPTLLISPLLSLMRNQIEAAGRIGIVAETINSTNAADWQRITDQLKKNSIDILIISPERLANDEFRQNVLSNIATNIGLFAVDEAHCISDWGHDFRPDYKRIVRIIEAIPANTPILATTATANNRVVGDVIAQLGKNIELIRGPLIRESLKLQNIHMPSPAARMAWLAQTIPTLTGSGIVYTLTQRDAERVTKWLQICDISAKAYHADIADSEDGVPLRELLEHELLNNEIKVLVATVALGMGFDKPDLGFVIHFQRPASLVHYYQQVGRAGRAVDNAYGVLLAGEEDDQISDFFIQNAFPPQQHISETLNALNASDAGLTTLELQRVLNIGKSQIDKTIKFLTVESPSPIVKVGTRWHATASALTYRVDDVMINSIMRIRMAEQQQMREYMEHDKCLMAFLGKALDDPDARTCGKCSNCAPGILLPEGFDSDLANRAALFLRRSYQPVEPRKQWPASGIFETYTFTGRNIPSDLQASPGRALSLWRDAGWGQMVAAGKYETHRFSDDLVKACVQMIKSWSPVPAPEWVTCVPSFNRPELVPDFAARLSEALTLPFIPCVVKMQQNQPQKNMENSYQQAKNLDGVFRITSECKSSPCFLVDDVVNSRWTFTIVSALLRQTGCCGVIPLALALNSPRMD